MSPVRTFYELFTGLRLFDHDRVSSAEVQRKKLSHEEPVFPRGLARKLPWEIRTILAGCLESEVRDRYESADHLVMDIQRYMHDEALTYRRPGVGRRTQLAYRRNKVLFRVAAVFLLLLTFTTVLYINRINQAKDEAQIARRKAEEANRDIIRNLAQPLIQAMQSSTDLLVVDGFWMFLEKCDEHLTPRYYPDSIEDSLASAQISVLIALSIIKKTHSPFLPMRSR